MSLVPCASCARHVRLVDTECPFCGSTTLVRPETRPRYFGRATLVVGLGAAMTVSCINSVYGAPSPPDPVDAAAVDAGLTKDAAKD